MREIVEGLKEVLAGFRGVEVLTREHPAGSLPAAVTMVPLNFAFEDDIGALKRLAPGHCGSLLIRNLELAQEAYQGVEQLSREYLEDGRPVSQVLKPLNDWTEKLLTQMEAAPFNGAQGTVVTLDKHR